MPRGDQISRQWQILRFLETSRLGISVPELATRLESNVRTVYRDMEALSFAGFPLCSEKVDGVERWKFMEGYRGSMPIPFEMTEVMALSIARDQLKAFEGTVFSDSLRSAFNKINSTLRPESGAFLETLSKSFRVGIGGRRDYRKHREMADLINKAVLEHLTVRIKYWSGEKERLIDPYHVWFMAGTIYIIAYCHTRKEPRLFVLDRIKKTALTDKKFEMIDGFSFDDFIANRFRVDGGDGVTDVKIRFSPSVAGYIKEWTWHPSQTITEKKNGSIILSMRVEGLFEVKNWILSFGNRAKVLEPKTLANDILKESRSITKLYK